MRLLLVNGVSIWRLFDDSSPILTVGICVEDDHVVRLAYLQQGIAGLHRTDTEQTRIVRFLTFVHNGGTQFDGSNATSAMGTNTARIAGREEIPFAITILTQ